MYHEISLDSVTINGEYRRNDRTCYFDPMRQILVVKTPEEEVRQKILIYLQETMKVPKDMIEVEVPMCHFVERARGRADIIVYGCNEDNVLNPVLVIECKAPSILLTEDVEDQVKKYNKVLNASHFMITNGQKIGIWSKKENQKNTFMSLSKIPNYYELLKRQNLEYVEEAFCWRRPRFEELSSKAEFEKGKELGILGASTAFSMGSFFLNISGALLEEKKRISIDEFSLPVICDGGLRYSQFGNAAGGTWVGDYRYFVVSDENGNQQIISFSIIGSFEYKDDEFWGNRPGYTHLIVAIDDFDKRHNSLQLNLDKFVEKHGERYTIFHDGRITVGRKGAAKKADLLKYVYEVAPELVDVQGRIFLGVFDGSREIDCHQKQMIDFLSRTMKYALVRDKFRRSISCPEK